MLRCAHDPEDRLKVRDVITLIERDGWRAVRMRGSHRQYRHPSKPGLVTIAGHPADEIHPKTLRSVMIQAGLEKQK